jgi:hypothetical protein
MLYYSIQFGQTIESLYFSIFNNLSLLFNEFTYNYIIFFQYLTIIALYYNMINHGQRLDNKKEPPA